MCSLELVDLVPTSLFHSLTAGMDGDVSPRSAEGARGKNKFEFPCISTHSSIPLGCEQKTGTIITVYHEGPLPSPQRHRGPPLMPGDLGFPRGREALRHAETCVYAPWTSKEAQKV